MCKFDIAGKWIVAMVVGVLLYGSAGAWAAAPFVVSLSPTAVSAPVTGRLIVTVSKKLTSDLYLRVYSPLSTIFGTDVSQLKPGTTATVGSDAVGSPMNDLAALPAGDYYAQALLVTYQKVTRSDGHTIWMPILDDPVPTWGKPGNLLSDVVRVHVNATGGQPVRLVLNHVIPPVPMPADTAWIKHVRIKSKIMSKFWGTNIYVYANVLLPKGFEQHPEAHYPVIFPFGHGERPFSFNSDPASNTMAAWERAKAENLKTGYAFYQEWNSDDFPRVVAITFQTPSPYFVEAYDVNSANNGPWGRAMTEEIIPYLTKEFRLIDQPYARIVEGASTGGWEALALELYYPKYFGGAWVFNPDPISFRHDQLADIYKDDNMFTSELGLMDYPFERTTEGKPVYSLRELARVEAVLGSHERSGGQLAIWQALHGPVGSDGYPVPLYDNLTGVIDHKVAQYYREHGFDLTYYVSDHWSTLGPELRGKLHFISGEMDNFYLNLGVYDFQHMIESHAPADYPISFTYGRPEKGHSWHNQDWASTVRDMAWQISEEAPPGSDLAQWHYGTSNPFAGVP